MANSCVDGQICPRSKRGKFWAPQEGLRSKFKSLLLRQTCGQLFATAGFFYFVLLCPRLGWYLVCGHSLLRCGGFPGENVLY